MQDTFLKKGNIAAVIITAAFLLAMFFVIPGESFALSGSSSGAERLIRFTYGYTECTGDVHPLSDRDITYSESTGTTYPEYFSTYMMLCDTDHVLHVEGYDISDENVTIVSSNPSVLDIDSEGNVTLKKTGTARVTATVAADDVYDERSVYLDVRVDRHEGWVDSALAYYAGRPASWGLALDVNDEPQQIVLQLRPGAGVTYTPEDPAVISVDQNGKVTPLKAGTTQIWFDVDNGGGRYKACRFGQTVIVSGDDLRNNQEITGDLGPFTIDWHDGLALDLSAQTRLVYSVIGGSCATVDQDGHVEFTKKGTAVIKVIAAATEDYKQAEATINITAVDLAEEEAARLAAEEAARQAAEEAARQAAEEAARLAAEEAAQNAAEQTSQTSGEEVSQNTETDLPQTAVSGSAQNTADETAQNAVGTSQTASGGSTHDTENGASGSAVIEIPQKTTDESAQDGSNTSQAAANGSPRMTAGSKRKVTSARKNTAQTVAKVSQIAARKAAESAQIAVQKAEKKNAEKAARREAFKRKIARAGSMKKPVLKAKALKGSKIKLTWNKVRYADGYIVYVKYPGSKKYVKAVARNSTVKSVTHKGLSKNRVYRYKIRAYKIVNGTTYYSPFSRVRKARAR